MRKFIITCIIGTLLFNLTACGTILYPERKGQHGGRLDVGVVALDGVGLILFLIPGIIAYAVDFSTGAIYLPSGKKHASATNFSTKDMTAVYVGKENLSDETIQAVIYTHTGQMVNPHDPALVIYKIKS